jgi:hypothetical protein
MVLKLSRGQPELRVRLVEPGGGPPLTRIEGVRLELRAAGPPPNCGLSQITREGCWPGFPTGDLIPTWDMPKLVYPAFGVDCDAAMIFRFDRHLWHRPPGRYIGTILLEDKEIAWLDIDLCDTRWIPELVEAKAPEDGRGYDI